MSATAALVGVLAVLAVLVGVYVMGRRGVFGEDDDSRDKTDELASNATGSTEHVRIPVRDKIGGLSGPAKLTLVATLLLAAYLAVGMYRVLQVGRAPSSFVESWMVQVALGLFGVIVGIIIERRTSAVRRRVIHILEHSDGSPSTVETIPFNAERVEYDNDGRPIIRELAKHRILGLFSRTKYAGEDRKLHNHRPPGDTVLHELPHDADETDDGDFVVRSSGRITRKDPRGPDYAYKPPQTLSIADAIHSKERSRRDRIKVEAQAATLAQAQMEHQQMKQKLENNEYKSREDWAEDFEALTEQLTPLFSEILGSENSGTGRVEPTAETSDD